MKRITTLILFLFITIQSFAQTEGISYQAVIIAPDVLELPGVDSEGNYLPSAEVDIRFSIIALPGSGAVEYTGTQTTTTDEFGRINLIIGQGNYDKFEEIDWNGDAKSLKVEIDFKNGDGFVDMSIEKLTYVPYVAHRNITASGTLDVDGDTFLNRELTVDGPTKLNSTLLVDGGNPTDLTGDLTVDGATNLNGTLDVNDKNITNLSGDLNVGTPGGIDADASTLLNGTLDVIGKTTVADFEATGQATFGDLESATLKVTDTTRLEGGLSIDSDSQIVISSSLHTAPIAYTTEVSQTQQVNGVDPGLDIENYPLLLQGSTQGLAIKVEGNRRNGNNFISFWDGTNEMWGRIEGEIDGEFGNNADYLFDQTSLAYDIYEARIDRNFAIADAAIGALQVIKAATDFRGCFGLGGCLASPGPADITFAAAEVISDGIQVGFAQDALNRARGYEVTYNENKLEFVGVSYASGAGDYAEYLLRAYQNEKMTYGDIVGVRGGKISKNTATAERFMVVSYKPIVLGNMPQPSEENKYEKVAFMGQVPVKVFGNVHIGDYIIPSGNNDGIGKAVAPSKIAAHQIKDIVGTAWTESHNTLGFNLVNVAVGLNRNDNNTIVERLEKKVEAQAEEIQSLKTQISAIHDMLSNPEKTNSITSKTGHQNHKEHEADETKPEYYDDRKYEIIDTDKGEIVYWEITSDDLERGLKMAEEQMRLDGVDVENNLLFQKLKNDPQYKERLLTQLKSKLDKQFHYHKDIDKKGGH